MYFVVCRFCNWDSTILLCCRLCEEYEKIAEKALTSPANTEHLMELKVQLIFFIQVDFFYCICHTMLQIKEKGEERRGDLTETKRVVSG